MRQIFSFMAISVDGFHAGPNGELDWQPLDDEFKLFSREQLDATGLLLFGRATYEGMVAWWPTPAGAEFDPPTAARMNSIPKIVASRTLEKTGWANTRLIRSDLDAELTVLKQQPGKDIGIFGSSALVVSLLQAGLVDQLRILIHPVVLGEGQRVFATTVNKIDMQLDRTRSFASGSVLHYYRPSS
jgi:dihydrofolate reductase